MSGATFIPAAQPVTKVTPQSGWTNYGGTYAPLEYTVDWRNRIQVQGLIKNTGGTSPADLFPMPQGVFSWPAPENPGITALDNDSTGTLLLHPIDGTDTGRWEIRQQESNTQNSWQSMSALIPASHTNVTSLTKSVSTCPGGKPAAVVYDDGLVLTLGSILNCTSLDNGQVEVAALPASAQLGTTTSSWPCRTPPRTPTGAASTSTRPSTRWFWTTTT